MAHPKLARSLKKVTRSKRALPFVSQLLLLQLQASAASSDAAGRAACRLHIASLYLTDRLRRELGPVRSLSGVRSPVSIRAGNKARKRRPDGVLLRRPQRRLLAAILLDLDAPDAALWTITRVDPWEVPSQVSRLDRQLLSVALLAEGELEASGRVCLR